MVVYCGVSRVDGLIMAASVCFVRRVFMLLGCGKIVRRIGRNVEWVMREFLTLRCDT